MGEYDESEDIESLLRSAVRGENQSSTTTDSTQPEAEDSATRRRSIRPGDNAFDSLHPLSEEQQSISDEERAALHNAAIPDKSQTPLQKKVQTRTDQDLWKDCDRGISAQRCLTGTRLLVIFTDLESDLNFHDTAVHSNYRIRSRAL